MVRYVLKQNKNEESKVFGKWFAYPLIEETLNLDSLAEHMSNHNSPYSKGVIKGLLTDMISCIKELLLEGKNVKVDDLAIFSLGIKNKKGGAASPPALAERQARRIHLHQQTTVLTSPR